VTPTHAFGTGAVGAEAVNRLGYRLLDELEAEPSPRNPFLSPCSLAFGVAMASNGAAGSTREELAGALGAEGLDEQELNRRFRDLRVEVEQPGHQLEVDLANAVWGPPGASFDAAFPQRVQEFYAAEVRILNVAGPAAAEVVNRWVSERTKGRIARLVSPDDLAAGPGCILSNAIYFKGLWAARFDPAASRTGPFTLPDGRRKDVQMMTRSGPYPYLETDELQAVCLDYMGGNLSMYVVLPGEGTALPPSRLEAALPQLQRAQVALTMPRFSARCELDLVRPLAELGLGGAFQPGADFSRMGLTGSFISALRHTACLDVSEEGTEAAASTAVVIGRSLPRTKTMVVDRPFLLAIVDRRSGLLLFLGRINEPEPIPAGSAAGSS
jgi:serpin B